MVTISCSSQLTCADGLFQSTNTENAFDGVERRDGLKFDSEKYSREKNHSADGWSFSLLRQPRGYNINRSNFSPKLFPCACVYFRIHSDASKIHAMTVKYPNNNQNEMSTNNKDNI